MFLDCSIINSLYGQVAGDLETCSRLWRIMSPSRLRPGATSFATAVNKFPSPLPPDRKTNIGPRTFTDINKENILHKHVIMIIFITKIVYIKIYQKTKKEKKLK